MLWVGFKPRVAIPLAVNPPVSVSTIFNPGILPSICLVLLIALFVGFIAAAKEYYEQRNTVKEPALQTEAVG